MDIIASKDQNGMNQLEIGPVILELPNQVVKGLYDAVHKHLNEPDAEAKKVLEKKLLAYRTLASKMRTVDDRIVQKFAAQLKPEHLVTLVRLSEGDSLYQKVVRNLSKQNARQFKMDYEDFNTITEHQACVYMEKIVPLIKKAAQEQKIMSSS